MNPSFHSLEEESRLERFALLMAARADYALIFLDTSGHILEWPASGTELLGWRPEEVLGQPFHFLFTPEDRDRGVPDQELAIAAQAGQATDDRLLLCREGPPRPTIGRVVPLRRLDGTLQGFAKYIGDASEIRRLQESERKFREIFETAQEGIWILDATARIVTANDRMAELIGYTVDEIVGRRKIDFTFPEDEARIWELFEQRRRGELALSVEVRFRHRDGREVLTLMSARPIVRDRRFAGALDMFTDITELELNKRMAERTAALEEKTRQLEDFCYTVAHDLRAPLRSVNGFATLAEEELAAGNTALPIEYLQRIKNSTRRLDHLIQDLMTYTRISTVGFEAKPVDLAAAVSTALTELESEIQRTGADVVCEGTFPPVLGERAMVEQVFFNLLSNALKFTAAGTAPHVRVWAAHAAARVRVSVRDQGIGIAAEYHQRIFRVFERLDKNVGRMPGTGIGLAVVARAVERMGGSCGVESAPGAGSTFWFELPAAS